MSTSRPATCLPARQVGVLAALTLGLLALGAVPASASPPPNDAAIGAQQFQPFTADNGRPTDLEAVAELAEATPDPGVPPCLGPKSFARTVWYVVPAAETPQELTVEASGQTLDVVDLAAFVQPPAPAGQVTNNPNVCDGAGAGAGDASPEPTSGISLRVPAGRSVLIQVGRRGRVGTPDNERAVVSLEARALTDSDPSPPGDFAGNATPRARASGPTFVALSGATTTEEDPAQPACPSLGSVWRRTVPTRSGTRLITATGSSAGTLTVFSGQTPTDYNALDCVNRAGHGAMQMVVPVRAHKPIWIRVGTDKPSPTAEATLLVQKTPGQTVIHGGPGGFDPTPFGPAGGLPAECDRTDVAHARIGGPRFSGTAKGLSRRAAITLPITVRRSLVCDVRLELVGPRGQVYAQGQAIRLKKRTRVRLARTQGFRKGVYRLRVTAMSVLGVRTPIKTTLNGRLR